MGGKQKQFHSKERTLLIADNRLPPRTRKWVSDLFSRKWVSDLFDLFSLLRNDCFLQIECFDDAVVKPMAELGYAFVKQIKKDHYFIKVTKV